MPGRTGLIPARLQAQLLALGIPAAKHTPDGLAGMFPQEFNIGAAGLDTEELGQALIHFAKHEIIAIPGVRAGSAIRKVQPGWHFCRFYRDSNLLLNLVAPYMAEGLRSGEGC